ncbi:hypothetical protein FEE95_03300 [Maribacter algarum]|uniref:Uncharacterized protein n=1 Tax=Maribacter algarum (ex Zhang et al. 2020) TaxID=2578118 RepID=A0A5S3PTY8_9FLAO|nr:hypothetical protein [Maribacter algarum]TMM58471.1 hypothetical protein FEE95_03300 [Maribacter algarum]
MDILFYLATASLILFMLLATYDGFYLHIWKYRLFDREESLFEHKTHTVRAILFPLIVWLLFINETSFSFFLTGIALVVIDIIVLGIDAYHEKESRSFMGGLPKWEYIVHLFANAFHFSAIILVLALRLDISEGAMLFVDSIAVSQANTLFQFVSVNVIPGATILALLHFILMLKKPKNIWLNYRSKVTCC